MKVTYTLLFFSSLFLLSCNNSEPSSPSVAKASLIKQSDNRFNDYWYGGKAELTGYNLELHRYGETRKGEAVLVFVTEPFNTQKQVKANYPDRDTDETISVLKLNALRKFTTGIYDYSMMFSVFTPVSLDKYPRSLKETCSVQDWCGHSFSQLNYQDGQYKIRQFSYFESEADIDKNLGDALLEDEIFTRLRINPSALVTDDIDLIPGLFFSRLTHENLKPRRARISLKSGNESTTQCLVEYMHLDRTVKINFGNDFPHEILSWEEIDNGKTTVTATKMKGLRSPYWKRNAREYEYLRDSLGLSGI